MGATRAQSIKGCNALGTSALGDFVGDFVGDFGNGSDASARLVCTCQRVQHCKQVLHGVSRAWLLVYGHDDGGI